MGVVIDFPIERLAGRADLGAGRVSQDVMGIVIILPAVRIEREIEKTVSGRATKQAVSASRKRRRRASRS